MHADASSTARVTATAPTLVVGPETARRRQRDRTRHVRPSVLTPRSLVLVKPALPDSLPRRSTRTAHAGRSRPPKWVRDRPVQRSSYRTGSRQRAARTSAVETDPAAATGQTRAHPPLVVVKHRIVVRAREDQDEAPDHAGALTDARLAAELAVDVEQVRMALVELSAHLDLRASAEGGWEIRESWPEVSD
jgi:hypothetical protein